MTKHVQKLKSPPTSSAFDVHGGADFIDINGTVFDVERAGQNTLITVQGDEILLIGIKPKDIDASDLI